MRNYLVHRPIYARICGYYITAITSSSNTVVGKYAQETHQEMRYPNVTSLYFAIPILFLTPPTEGFPWDDLRNILRGGQRLARVQNGIEILPKVSIS